MSSSSARVDPPPDLWETHGLRAMRHGRFGLTVFGPEGVPDGQPTPYLDPILADPSDREAFFTWVDQEGLIVCKNLTIEPAPYRPVGGKRTPNRLSQGEYFHHDGCSAPVNPRVVEIRCPPQERVRAMGTTIAPFPEVVVVMLRHLPASLRRDGLNVWHEALDAGEALPVSWDHVQGVINRTLRALPAATARAWFLEVDRFCGYTEPWTLGESRFMANQNNGRTVQHRRACPEPWVAGVPNGGLLKRWPAEELDAPMPVEVCEPCARADRWSDPH